MSEHPVLAVQGFRCCLLSGGNSRRMGSDKALLPHPSGGNWLEANLILLSRLGFPVTLLSGHQHHLRLARQLADLLPVDLSGIQEPQPPKGPLLALQRLMDHYPDQRLLLCPVDMPELTLASLVTLVASAVAAPGRIHIAHDGQRPQPLLGLYPACAYHRHSLAAHIASGGRALQAWLAQVEPTPVLLPHAEMRNVNRPEELTPAPMTADSAPLQC